MAQYRNTVADLAAWALGSASMGQTIVTELATPLDALPDDRREAVPQDLHGSYRRLDQSLQQIHVEATYDVAVALGAALTTSARLGTVVGACATDTNTSNDASCLDAFIKKFGARALRRPLATDEVDFYKTAYGTSTRRRRPPYADLIGLFVTAPEFMYFVEHGDNAVAGQTGVYDVSPHELASRLSYQLWQTAPDDALLAAAADGSLRTAAVYDAQVTRLLADPRARPALDEFFADWMKVEDLPAMDAKNADATFKTFAGADLPDAKLRQAMIDDVVGMLDYYTWTMPSRDRGAVHQRPVVRARRAPGEALRRRRLERHRRAARAAGRPAPGPADARAVPVDGQREHAADHEGRLPAHERPVRHDPAAAAGRQRQAARAEARA